MQTTNVDTLDKTVQQTNVLLKDIEKKFGWEGQPEIAYDALRAVLHTLRDRLTVEEAADFAAQLPMLVRGLFYDGWKPSKMPMKMDKEEFLAVFRERSPLSLDHSRQELIRGVLSCVGKYVSKGEMNEIQGILPEKLARVIKA